MTMYPLLLKTELVASSDQQTIFQEFKQLGAKPSAEGLGLGLAITKRICDLLKIL